MNTEGVQKELLGMMQIFYTLILAIVFRRQNILIKIRKPSSVINAKKERKTIEWERLEISSRILPLRGEGSCGGGGAPRDSAGSGATSSAHPPLLCPSDGGGVSGQGSQETDKSSLCTTITKSLFPPCPTEGPRHLHRIPRLSEAPWEVP